jgi:hypothetical protein
MFFYCIAEPKTWQAHTIWKCMPALVIGGIKDALIATPTIATPHPPDIDIATAAPVQRK